MHRWLMMAALVALTGCAATVDKASVKATAGAPVPTQVEILRIPYDAAVPTYVVTVEPLRLGTEGGPSAPIPAGPGRRWGWGPFGWGLWGVPDLAPAAYTPPPAGITDRIGNGVAAQLISAFGNVGNVIVLDYEHYLKNKDNIAALRRHGELGPFVIKGTVTEFNEVAEAEQDRQGASLGWTGTVLGIAGAVARVPGAAIAGAALSAADPTYENTKMRRTGSVAMDLQVIDPESGRIFGTVVAAGKFTAVSATSGLSVFGVGGGGSSFAASGLGQATRTALNDAVAQVLRLLRK